uniref:hypothetical protein n=1 Tax=Roseivirga sp. TaxID=1964215 RepID=UPI004047087F
MSSTIDKIQEKEAEYEELLLDKEEAQKQIARTKKLLQQQLSLYNEILERIAKNPFHK